MAEIVIPQKSGRRKLQPPQLYLISSALVVLLYYTPHTNPTPPFNHHNFTFASSDTPIIKYTYIEHMPRFPGHVKQYILSHLHYPDSASRAGIQGHVVVTFIINEDGSVSNTKVVKGIGYGCDQEALNIISNMPRWQPAMQDDKPVKAPYTVVIPFVLY